MPIFHDKKVIFVHVPKTGGTTIRKMINFDNSQNKCNINNLWGYPNLGFTDYSFEKRLKSKFSKQEIEEKIKEIFGTKKVCLQHISLKEIQFLMKEIFEVKGEEYNSYGIVRDPLERFFSAFFNKQYLNKGTENREKFNKEVIKFINSLESKRRSEFYDGKYCHYRKQSDLLEGTKNIFLFEDIDNAAKEICNAITTSTDATIITKENKNRNNSYITWPKKINHDTIEIIENYYKKDFLLYRKAKKEKDNES